MCGRFTRLKNLREIMKRFNIQIPEIISADLTEKNDFIVPGQDVWIVYCEGGKNILAPHRWGLVPPWAKDSKTGSKMINARVETIAEKPSFKNSFLNSRCLIIADGYYEWLKQGTKKTPYHFHLDSRELFGFAGIRSWWQDGQESLQTCAMITAPAHEKIAEIHPRMPVIIAPELEKEWLNPHLKNPEALRQLLRNNRNDGLEYQELSVKRPGNTRQISLWDD
ncbi:MAG: SOS response-associated peptidase [Peptococcaceae bacterium]